MTQAQQVRFCFAFLMLGFFLLPQLVCALDFTESFTDSTYLNSSASTCVWNSTFGFLHPPLFVKDWQDGATTQSTNFDVGQGLNGPFNVSTYARFSVGGDVSGNIIRIDTDQFPEIQVTDFTLEPGWEIRPVGSRPLIIRSLLSVLIQGSINCDGEDGASPSSTLTARPAGGTPHCGGGRGGDGAYQSTAATLGADGGAGVTGGQGGGDSAGALGGDGGGGGGAFSVANATAGTKNSAGAGSAAGASLQDDGFTNIGGGAGGGGGGMYALVDGKESTGGGGGAGGGSVSIYAVQDVIVTTDSLNGVNAQIVARGGQGGGGAGFGGGAGGGGGGGSIQVFAGNSVQLDGVVSAVGGTGGATTFGGAGGTSATGRTWVVGLGGAPGGTVTPTPNSQLVDVGHIRYQTNSCTARSTVIDLGGRAPRVTNLAADFSASAGDSVSLQVATSDYADFSQSSSFVDISQLSSLPARRYLVFKADFTNTDELIPSILDTVRISYDSYRRDEYQFRGACGHVDGSGPASAFLFLIPLLIVLSKRVTISNRI